MLGLHLYILPPHRLSLDVDVYAALLVYNRFVSNAGGVGGGSCDNQVRTLYTPSSFMCYIQHIHTEDIALSRSSLYIYIYVQFLIQSHNSCSVFEFSGCI